MLAGSDPDSPYLALGELGTPVAAITHRIDTAAFHDRPWEAIRCHASQASPFDNLPEDLARAFLTMEHLVEATGAPVR